MSDPTALVSTEWLAHHIDAPDVRILDGTYALPAMGIDARAAYEESHIPGAIFFDIDDISDDKSELPHMLPPPEKFASRMRKMGIGDGHRIVVYDQIGIFSSARVWWMFRVFGHADVAVLDGGLPKWLAEGRPVTDDPSRHSERHFTARFNAPLVRDLDQLRGNLAEPREQVVDVRAPGRYAGTDPEPRPGMRSGHIPSSLNLPFTDLLDPETKTMLPKEQLMEKISASGLKLDQPIVASCGSGVTACVMALAGYLNGKTDIAVYDGSWSEWGSRRDTPIEA